MNLNHPFIARRNPPRGDVVPAGFVRHRLAIASGLPVPLALPIPGVSAAVLLTLPSGRVRGWMALDPMTVIASGAEQCTGRSAVDMAGDAFAAARARPGPLLMVMIDRVLGDTWPLVLGGRHVIERGVAGARRALCEIVLLDFQLTAGCLTSATPAASWIDLAIRPLASGNAFPVPMARGPLHQSAIARTPQPLPLETVLDSAVGGLADGTPAGGINWWLAHDHA